MHIVNGSIMISGLTGKKKCLPLNMKYLKPISGHEFYINLNITSKCNFSCPYCLAKDLKPANFDMSIDTVYSLATQLKLLEHPVIINITGGEPTLHPRLYDIISILSQCASNIIVFTNASKKLLRANCSYTVSLHPQSRLKLVYSHIKEVKDLVNRVYIMESLSKSAQHQAQVMFDEFNTRLEPLAQYNTKLSPGPRDLIFNGHPISFRELVALKLNRFKGWQCHRACMDILADGTISSRCFPDASVQTIDSWITCTNEYCTYEDDIRGEKYLPSVSE